MKKSQPKWRVVGLLSIISLVLAGCGEPFLSTLKPAGEVAKMQYDLMVLSTIIMLLVIVVVTVIFLVVMFRFRRKGDDKKIPKQIEGSHKLEIIWTVIPIVLLIILAVPTVYYTFKLDDVKAIDQVVEEGKERDAIVINVRAHQYWWEFEYPDYGVVTSQELIVPTDEKVYFQLSASDVKHSFWIPAIGGKIDTNTDNVNKFYLEFDSEKADVAKNLFYGKCAELCGDGHALMDFKVKTLSKSEFQDWLSDMKRAPEKPIVDGDLATQGEEIFNQSCIGCHAVSPSANTPAISRQAPNLANFGEREHVAGVKENDAENIKAWLTDTQAVKPGNKMPSYGTQMSDQELDALVAYLQQLKVHEK